MAECYPGHGPPEGTNPAADGYRLDDPSLPRDLCEVNFVPDSKSIEPAR